MNTPAMKRTKEWEGYSIPFLSMKAGRHPYHFEVDDAFFAVRERSLIQAGHLDVDVDFDKRDAHHFELTFHLRGHYHVTCDRCLDEFDLPVKGEFVLRVERKDAPPSEDEDLLYLPLHAHEVDVSEYIYQYAHLLMPFRKVCAMGNKACDPEMEKIIARYSPHKLSE